MTDSACSRWVKAMYNNYWIAFVISGKLKVSLVLSAEAKG